MARTETELYPPVKKFLESQGYEVRGEVNGCDLAAMRGDELILVELKPAMNLTLVLQGIQRLKLSDTVYLAVEAPRGRQGRRWREIVQLCRRLGLGLLAVSFGPLGPRVEVPCDPGPYQPRPAADKRRRLLGEFQRRSGDHNQGGSSRRPLVTAYREEALRLAAEMARRGQLSPKELREATGCAKAGSILRENHYGWFYRVSKGVYALTPAGEQALVQYAEVVADHGSA